MRSLTRDFSISIQTAIPFEECLSLLRGILDQEGFQPLAVIPFHREFERQMGVRWHRYTVLVVWSPFPAYQAVLSDQDAGIFMPFHFIVSDDGDHTTVAVTNLSLFGELTGTIGVQILVRDLVRKIQQILSQLSTSEELANDAVRSQRR